MTNWLTITIHILLNISRGKGSQTIKFGKVIEYKRGVFFFKNHAENEASRLFLNLCFVL